MLLVTHDLGVAADRAHRLIVMRGGGSSSRDRRARSWAIHGTRTPGDLLTRASRRHRPAGARLTTAAATRRQLRRTVGQRGVPATAPQRPTPRHLKEFASPGTGGASRPSAPLTVSAFRSPGRAHAIPWSVSPVPGKPTAARILLRLIHPDSGEALVAGRDVTGLRGRRCASCAAGPSWSTRTPTLHSTRDTPCEHTVTEPLRIFGVGDRQRDTAWPPPARLLDQVGAAGEHWHRPPPNCPAASGSGWRSRERWRCIPLLVLDDTRFGAGRFRAGADPAAAGGPAGRTRAELPVHLAHHLAVVRQISDAAGVAFRGVGVEPAPPGTCCCTRSTLTPRNCWQPFLCGGLGGFLMT